ncbi:MAG: phage tail protein, partial [Pseudomonadota bacterium]|nr:phage tail protein [Pseudomonadota bacterium]
MTISLDIPSTRVPGSYIDFDSSQALSGLPAVPKRVLIIGQLLAAATVAALTAVQMFSAGQGVAAFGRGSMLAQMVAAFKGANDQTECWAIGVADLLAGTFATQTLTFTGPATGAGTLPLMVAGTSVPVGVNAGDTATVVATATAAAVNALPDLPVSAAAAAGVVTLTARHKGLCGNDIDVRLAYYPGDTIPTGL